MSFRLRLKVWPLILALAGVPLRAQQFFPDDPLEKEPPPFSVEDANLRQLSVVLEVMGSVFKNSARVVEARGVVSAQGVNTLGEVLDGPWYMNRHARRRLTEAELMRGSGDQDPPSRTQPWRVLAANRFGPRQGLLIADSRNALYLLRFDPVNSLELSTGAAMVGSRIFHALGYWVPEHYLMYVQRPELVASPNGQQINSAGKAQKLGEDDIDLLLRKTARDPAKGYRAIALKVPSGAKLIGPYQFFGRRSDDPNDIVPHEHRRDLRGLYVISAWVGNNWLASYQTSDALVSEGETRYIRHYFVDFLNFLGAGARQEKQAREGNDPFVDFHSAARNLAGLGLHAPAWQRAKFPGIESVGAFESRVFDPAKWMPNFPSAPLSNRTPADDYWAARQVLAFTDEDIRAIVRSGQYSNPAAAEWIAKSLMERRDKIARYFLEGVLPLDRWRIEDRELKFDDLAALRGLRPAGNYSVEWAEFRNHAREHTPIPDAKSFQIPEQLLKAKPGLYFSAKVTADNGDPQRLIYVYMRVANDGPTVVGIDRMWPGQKTAEQVAAEKQIPNRYAELLPRQRELFDSYAAAYNKKTGFHVVPSVFYDSQSVSERTTFEAITNALSKTELSDKTGKSLSTAIDLVTGIERIAGQYYGRSGDEQFRLYCLLRPDARQVIENAREFRFTEENTVFHAGYPYSYRQAGKVPTLQFSISADGLKADIDVDYRSSKPPQAVWNGHLSSTNSDVRARDNYKRHGERWAGLVNWWQGRFGNLGMEEAEPPDLLANPRQVATPIPPDRPPNAEIAEVQDAIQEFLTDWLVRHKYDEALQFVSDKALSCVGENSNVVGGMPQDRGQLRQLMKQASERLGRFDNLTDAIGAVVPWRKAFRVQRHPFEREFTLVQAPDAYAKAFECQNRSDAALTKAMDDPDPTYGNYFGAVFRVKTGDNAGGALGLLWTRENNAWRLVSWKVFGQ